MKKVVSTILVLVLCLSYCFALAACSDAKSSPFDTQTEMEIAEFSLQAIVYNHGVLASWIDITEKTTIGDVVDALANCDYSVEYAFINESTKFVDVCEIDEKKSEANSADVYRVKPGISPSEYYSATNYDLDTAKRLIAKCNFSNILKMVDELKLWPSIDDETTIREVVSLIEAKGETVSTKHLNLSRVFCSAARQVKFEGMPSQLRRDVEWLDFFAE